MLQVSNTKQVSLQVMLKKERKKQVKKEKEISLIDDDLENLILKLNGNKDSSKKDKSKDPFDNQLKDWINQLEVECKDVDTIGKKRSERDPNNSTREYIGKGQRNKSSLIKQEVHEMEEIEVKMRQKCVEREPIQK